MSGGFFRGTSADQDTRFSNKQAKLLKTQKFAPELEHLVDISKVKMDVIKPWIARRVTELIGIEDEVLINFIYGLLDAKEVNGKNIQIQLTGFMEKNTGKFMKELWELILSAQNNASGVPQQFLDAKEEETRKKKEETERIFNEIHRRKEKESKETEHEEARQTDGGLHNNSTKESLRRPERGSRIHPKDENGAGVTNGSTGRKRSSKSPYSSDHSPSPHRERSMSRSSISCSPRERRRSITPMRRSARESISPRQRSHPRRRSSSRTRHRSPSPLRRRVQAPIHYRRSPSPRAVYARRYRSPPRRYRSPSPPRRHLSRSPHRRSRQRPPSSSRSRSPVRRRPSSPRRRRSPYPSHRRSPTPNRRPLSPYTRKSQSPYPSRRRSPTPNRRPLPPYTRKSQSPYPSRRRSPTPNRRPLSPYTRKSKSPPRRRSSSPLRSPSLAHRRSPSPARKRYPSRSRSPASGSSISPVKTRSHRIPKSPQGGGNTRAHELPRMDQRQLISLSPQRGHAARNSPLRKVPPISPSHVSQTKQRSRSPSESPYMSMQNSREDGEKYSNGQRNVRSSDGKKESPCKSFSQRHNGSDSRRDNKITSEEGYEKKEARSSNRSPRKGSLLEEKSDVPLTENISKSEGTRSTHPKDIRVNLRTDSFLVDPPNLSSDSEGGRQSARVVNKRKNRKSTKQDTTSEDSSSDSEIEDRKEAKRRRKEEKKLRKEERKRRREERRRRRKDEKRAIRRKKDMSKDSDISSYDTEKDEKKAYRKYSSSDEETESLKKRLENDLREKALESLRSKKGISR